MGNSYARNSLDKAWDMGRSQTLSVLFCPVWNVTLGDLDQMRALNALRAQCRQRTNSLSLFRRTKLGNQAFLVLLCAKGHRSWETDEVIDLRTQTKQTAKVRTMLVLLVPAQYLDSRPNSPPHSAKTLDYLFFNSSIFFPIFSPFEIPN